MNDNDFKAKGFHSKSEMRRVEAMKETDKPKDGTYVPKERTDVAKWLYVGKTITQFKNVYAILEPFPHFPDKTWLVEESAYLAMKQERDELKGQLERLRAEHHVVVKAGQGLREERDELKAENERLRAAIQNMQQQEHSTIKILKQHVEDYKTAISEMRAKLTKAKAALKSARYGLELAQDELYVLAGVESNVEIDAACADTRQALEEIGE